MDPIGVRNLNSPSFFFWRCSCWEKPSPSWCGATVLELGMPRSNEADFSFGLTTWTKSLSTGAFNLFCFFTFLQDHDQKIPWRTTNLFSKVYCSFGAYYLHYRIRPDFGEKNSPLGSHWRFFNEIPSLPAGHRHVAHPAPRDWTRSPPNFSNASSIRLAAYGKNGRLQKGPRTDRNLIIPHSWVSCKQLTSSVSFGVYGLQAFFEKQTHILHMGVSENSDTPKSSILIGFSHHKPSILGSICNTKQTWQKPIALWTIFL